MELIQLQEPLWMLILRPVVIYLFILFMLRVLGKREIGEMTPLDLAVLLILSETLQPGLVGSSTSVSGSIISAGVLLLANYGMVWLRFRSRRLEGLVSGNPVLLIYQGSLIREAMKREHITEKDLLAQLREQGIFSLDEVQMAILEDDGRLSVKQREDKPRRGRKQEDKRPH